MRGRIQSQGLGTRLGLNWPCSAKHYNTRHNSPKPVILKNEWDSNTYIHMYMYSILWCMCIYMATWIALFSVWWNSTNKNWYPSSNRSNGWRGIYKRLAYYMTLLWIRNMWNSIFSKVISTLRRYTCIVSLSHKYHYPSLYNQYCYPYYITLSKYADTWYHNSPCIYCPLYIRMHVPNYWR